jgi:glucose-1-phosphate thymidylyltransferase
MITKGIVLAGGAGTRLHPLTNVVCKQLLPVYDKPLVFYPLATLMQAGIRDILLISTPRDLPRFRQLFGDGSKLGLRISYAEQPSPDGIAQAFIIGREFIGDQGVALILGDNIFHGNLDFLREALRIEKGGAIFAYPVGDPERYGVLEFDESGQATDIEEKPKSPKSNYAVAGLYLFDRHCVEVAARLQPSTRGELEITDLARDYLLRGELVVKILEPGVSWLDTGTHEGLLEAGNYIATIEKRRGSKIGCIEQVALEMGFVNRTQFAQLISGLPHSPYRAYLERL